MKQLFFGMEKSEKFVCWLQEEDHYLELLYWMIMNLSSSSQKVG